MELLSDIPERFADELRVMCQEILSILARPNNEIRKDKRKKQFTIERLISSVDVPDRRKSKHSFLISQSLNNAKSISLFLREMNRSNAPHTLITSGILSLEKHTARLKGGEMQNPLHVKQGTQALFQLRKAAPVTGSSFYDALGLRSLKEQKAHIERYINGTDKHFDDDTKKLLDWGKNNECHAVATLVGYGLPILYKKSLFTLSA